MHKKNNPDWPTSLSGFFVSRPLAYFPEKTILLVCSYLVYSSTSKIKKSFFYFLPSHPHKCGSSALFIGGSRVRVSVRVNFLLSHLPSHYPHTSGTGKYSVRGLLQNLTKVPEKYSCLVPTVQHRYTNSIAMLHYQYSYAGLSV